MKVKQILVSMALPALLAACANEELLNDFSNEAVNGNLVKLEKGFAVGVTKGGIANTRVSWELGEWGGKLKYSWLPEFKSGTEINPEHIGFAWRGDTPDANVRTNYKFTLAGYLKNGQTQPTFKKCDDKLLITNGYTIGDINDSKIALNKYDDATKTMISSSYSLALDEKGTWSLKDNNTPIADMYDANKLSEDDPSVKSGIFTTDNSTVFAGEYIVYFPFNQEFAEISNLPATSPSTFTMDVAKTGNLTAHLTGKTFAYGIAEITKGGQLAEGFSTQNLSNIIAIKIKNSTENNQSISKVILFDEGSEKGFYTSVGLDANKISQNAKGRDLYVEDAKTQYSPTLILNLKNGETPYATINDSKEQIVTLAALPLELVKPVVYIMFSDGLCVKKELEAKPLNPSVVAGFNVELKKEDLNNKVSIVVDTKTFLQAWANAWDAPATVKDVTIETLGNITFNSKDMVSHGASLTETFDLSKKPNGMLFNKNITIKGIGTLTIPADVTWYVKGREDSKAEAKTLTIENPIVIENAGCCGTNTGRLVLGNKEDKFGNFLIQSDIKNYGGLYVGVNNGTGTYTFEGNIENKFDADLGAANIFFGGKTGNEIVVKQDIANDGNITLKARVYNVGDNTWATSVPTQVGVVVKAQAISNNLENSKLTVENLTHLELNGNSINNGTIEIMSNNGTVKELDGTIIVKEGASLTNNNTISNKGVFNADRSTLTLNEGSEFYDFVGSQYGGRAAKNNGGEYICDVDNADKAKGNRLAYALDSEMPTTTVRFVEGPNGAIYTYDLKDYKDYTKLATVKYIIAVPITKDFIVKNSVTTELTWGSKVTVESARSLKFTNGKVKINGDLTAKAGFVQVDGSILNVAGNVTMTNKATDFNVKGASASAATQTTPKDAIIGGDFVLANNSTLKVEKNAAVTLNKDLTIGESASAEFAYSTYTNVAKNIAINGTFIRELSSGVATANPAKVWCESYTTGPKADIVNGFPEERK